MTRSHRNWGNLVGFLAAIAGMLVMIYGSTLGMNGIWVNEVSYASPSLPKAFEGYRIALFSDLHLGTYGQDTQQVEKMVATVNDLKPDMICFVGDLQNMQPTELDIFQSVLSRLQAPDGVFSVLGNHDYPVYIKADFATEALNENLIKSKQRSMGWRLLLNERQAIKRGNDSIIVVGMENMGKKPHPQKGDIEKALEGVSSNAFVLMLQHDPSAWRKTILTHEPTAQLTLSGHTHGGQFSLFGWSPASITHREWRGMYDDGQGHSLFVTTGIGGLAPFRFGMKPEVVVLTLTASQE